MEQRLIDMLKTKTGKVSDLLQVEKELGRVREEIEKMQGELKYWDSQIQFATVTISLAEKDMEEPAGFLIKERSQLALYAPDVEKIYNDIKALASSKIQITNAQLNRDYSGRVSAIMSILIAPEESDAVISRVKSFGRVENFQTQTERIAQGGTGMAENAKTKRDKVELNITISREEQEQAFQQTNLRIRTSAVDEKAKDLRSFAEKEGREAVASGGSLGGGGGWRSCQGGGAVAWVPGGCPRRGTSRARGQRGRRCGGTLVETDGDKPEPLQNAEATHCYPRRR